MAILLRMPSLSPTMESGVISVWKKQEGEFIDIGEVLAEVETDKAVMDYEMVDEGFVVKIIAQPGQELPVGAPIAILAEAKDADISDALAEAEKGVVALPREEGGEMPAGNGDSEPFASQPAAVAPPPSQPAMAAPVQAAAQPMPTQPPLMPPPAAMPPESAASDTNGSRVRISPYGRKLAEANNINWQALSGSGPGGRIIAEDIKAAMAGGGSQATPARPGLPAQPQAPAQARSVPAAPARPVQPPPPPGVAFQDFPVSMMRKAIARKMEESKQTVPHFQATRKVRVDTLVGARLALNNDFQGEAKISVNDMIVKACATALRQHPTVNSQYLGDRIRQLYTVDICVAVGTDDGLITPVVRNVDQKGLWQISAEIRELAGRAREKKLAPEEYTGGGFTISNLGMYGITEFNGIINTPQAALLAVSGIVKEPVVEGDAIVPGQTMNITLSSDHRIVDGLAAAQFLDTLTRILENPVAMLL